MIRVAALLVGGALVVASATARAACTSRPTDAAGYQGYAYGDVEVKSHATPRVRVHWATAGKHAPDLDSSRADGVPDAVAIAGETAETALAKYAELGFRAVPSDEACGSNGGDGKLDVYLVAFSGADGACVAQCSGTTCSSFVLVEADFRGRGYATAEEGFRTVVTHELFHAVQNAYATGVDPFWSEGTAQWAMNVVYPELPDFASHLAAFFAEPSRSIDAPPNGPVAGYLYGSAVWPLYLSRAHGSDTVRRVYEAEGSTGQAPLEAIDAVLRAKGTSLAEAYPMFAAWTAATGALAGSGGFPDAPSYPGVAAVALGDGASGITSGLSYAVYRGTLPARLRVSLETDPARNGGVLVPIEDGMARLERALRLPADAEGEVLVVVSGTTTKKTDAPFAVRFGEPSAAPASDDGCSSSPNRGGFPFLVLLGLAIFGRSRRR